MRNITLIIILICLFLACSKEKETPTPIIVQQNTNTPISTTNSNPALILTLPGQNLTLPARSFLKIEGIATDAEGLKGIVYNGVSVGNYYTSMFTDTFFISGTNVAFSDSIFIPENSSPGNLTLQFYAIDLADSTSNVLTRNETINDLINPNTFNIANSVNEFDSVIINVHRNSFNIVDSLDIFNHTTGQQIGSLKDNIGFKVIKLKLDEGIGGIHVALFKDLITDNSTSYHIKLPSRYPGFAGYGYYQFVIGLDELDDISTSPTSSFNYHNISYFYTN